MALLAIDVGNTQTVFGLFEGEELREHWRVATERNRSGDELGALYGSFVDLGAVEGVALASTVPQLHRSYEDFAKEYAKAELLELGPGVKTGVPIRYDDPREVGPDRIANAVAAVERYGRAGDRGRLRHLDELRRRLAGGRVRRRRARARDRGLDGGALLAGGAAVQGRLRRAGDGDREEHRLEPAVRARLRVRGPGGRDRRADPRASSARRRRRSRRAAWPT